MPYTRAVVHEVQRFANIVATNGLRMTTRDTEIGVSFTFWSFSSPRYTIIGHYYLFGLQGHFIPVGTIVNADIHYLMAHDPIFENPTEFRPERYLNEDGKGLKKVCCPHLLFIDNLPF